MHFCCRKAKNSCFAPKPWFTAFLLRISRKTQHTRFEDKILRKLANEDKPQVVTACILEKLTSPRRLILLLSVHYSGGLPGLTTRVDWTVSTTRVDWRGWLPGLTTRVDNPGPQLDWRGWNDLSRFNFGACMHAAAAAAAASTQSNKHFHSLSLSLSLSDHTMWIG